MTRLYLFVRHAEEPLGSGAEGHVIALDLDVGHRLHRNGHAFLGVSALDLERNREDVQRKVVHLLEEREAEGRAALDHAVAHDFPVARPPFPTAEDRHRVGRHFQIVPAEKSHGHNEAKTTHITMMGTKNCVITFMTSPRLKIGNGNSKFENRD